MSAGSGEDPHLGEDAQGVGQAGLAALYAHQHNLRWPGEGGEALGVREREIRVCEASTYAGAASRNC